jgi:dihydroorotate dehydrogenase
VKRDGLTSEHRNEIGGLSGKPLKESSTKVLRDIYELTEGKIPLIGVGGVFTGRDALDKIEAGASLVQLYSAIALEGNSDFRIFSRLRAWASVGH